MEVIISQNRKGTIVKFPKSLRIVFVLFHVRNCSFLTAKTQGTCKGRKKKTPFYGVVQYSKHYPAEPFVIAPADFIRFDGEKGLSNGYTLR